MPKLLTTKRDQVSIEHRQTATKGGPPAEKPAPEKPAAVLPPLPADAHVQQEMKLDGKTLKYTVTVGALPVRDKDGKIAGQVVTTAYTVEGENRPARLPDDYD